MEDFQQQRAEWERKKQELEMRARKSSQEGRLNQEAPSSVTPPNTSGRSGGESQRGSSSLSRGSSVELAKPKLGVGKIEGVKLASMVRSRAGKVAKVQVQTFDRKWNQELVKMWTR